MSAVHNWDMMKLEDIATDSNGVRLSNLTVRTSSALAAKKQVRPVQLFHM